MREAEKEIKIKRIESLIIEGKRLLEDFNRLKGDNPRFDEIGKCIEKTIKQIER